MFATGMHLVVVCSNHHYVVCCLASMLFSIRAIWAWRSRHRAQGSQDIQLGGFEALAAHPGASVCEPRLQAMLRASKALCCCSLREVAWSCLRSHTAWYRQSPWAAPGRASGARRHHASWQAFVLHLLSSLVSVLLPGPGCSPTVLQVVQHCR